MSFLFVRQFRQYRRLHRSAVLVSLFALVVVSCSKSPNEVPRSPSAQASLPTNNAAFYILQTELSPAILVFSTNKYLSVFTGLDQYGLNAPSHLAFATQNGPRAFTNGARLVTEHMDESWLLVWFAGAKDWTNSDVPWAVLLQRKPASMQLDSDGLHFGFRGGAEHVVLLPLYGSYTLREGAIPTGRSPKKPPRQGAVPPAPPGHPKLPTSKWSEVLTTDVLMRVRYWAASARHFPISATVNVNHGKETITVRYGFEWLSTRDDWNATSLKLAPIPPLFAVTATNKQSVVHFSGPAVDLEYSTPSGPYIAIQNTDEYSITFPGNYFTNQVPATWNPSFEGSATNTNPHLLTSVHADPNSWPRLVWPDWKTPTGEPCTFGHITTGATNVPTFRTIRVNPNTQMLLTD